ncbi:MAG: imidazolonepropionase-like amidohydrolase [Phenylobacterium sp.]|jgi:imidazolonepropionase-like amidohydrolase
MLSTTTNPLSRLNRISKTLAAIGLFALTASAQADSLAIINATVHTASEQGVLKGASIIVEDGVISAINPATVTADQTIDAKGRIVTPGFIAAFSQLGLVEVGAVAETRDAYDDKADITFDPSLAFNPQSTAIPYSRKGGITRSVLAPRGGKTIFAGQTSVIDLSGSFDSVINPKNGVLVKLGGKEKGSRALSLQTLINKFEDAEEKLAKAAKKKAKKDKKDKGESKPPSREEKLVNLLLEGKKPLIVAADRASELLQLIKLKQRFGLNLVIVGASDAIVVAEQLAKADVPVIIDAMQALPGSFDSLHPSLENPGKLVKAGVKVIFASGGAHALNNLRFEAGTAVSYGMSPEAALAAMTVNVAQALNINAGSIAVGKPADLVLWSGDPFELSSKVDKLWINGEEHSTDSRQDALRNRYMRKSELPVGYSK